MGTEEKKTITVLKFAAGKNSLHDFSIMTTIIPWPETGEILTSFFNIAKFLCRPHRSSMVIGLMTLMKAISLEMLTHRFVIFFFVTSYSVFYLFFFCDLIRSFENCSV